MKKLFLTLWVLGYLLSGGAFAYAQTTQTTNTITSCGPNCNLGYTPLEPIPGLTTNTTGAYDLTTSAGFSNLINAIFKILISAGALISVLSLTIGGVQYMVTGSAAMKGKAIERVKASMWGILLIAGIWLILNTINPHLLNFNFNPCPVNSATCASINLVQNNTVTTAAAPTTVTAPPPPAGAILASPDAIQFNNQDSNTTATKQAEGAFTQQCQSGGGVPIFNAGNNSGQTAMECIVMAGSQG